MWSVINRRLQRAKSRGDGNRLFGRDRRHCAGTGRGRIQKWKRPNPPADDGMSNRNPRRPLSEPVTDRFYTPLRVFLMALAGSILMAVAVVGGLGVAAENNRAAIVPSGLVVAYAAASIWCGRLAVRIYRKELRK